MFTNGIAYKCVEFKTEIVIGCFQKSVFIYEGHFCGK
jgi:hypothetical protein